MMFNYRLTVILFICCTFSIFSYTTDFRPANVITEKGAWCWFAAPRAISYHNDKIGVEAINKTFIGYIDVHGAIKATQIDHNQNTREEVLIRSYFQPDDHNNPTFLILPDERVMVFYSRHTDEACFYYRISQKPGDIRTLGEEVRLSTKNNTTYPTPYILSDDPGHIYLCWRGIGWHPTIGRLPMPNESNDFKVAFDWQYQIVQSTGARPYAKYVSNGKDRIYLTYTTGHPDNEYPNWIYFNYIDINNLSLMDIAGNKLATIGEELHHVNKSDTYAHAHPTAIVDNIASRDWVWEVSLDAEEKPVIAMVRINSAQNSHEYYHAKWTGSEWKKTALGNAGSAFHQTPGREKSYSAGMAIDKRNPNIFYCAMPVDGKYGHVYEIIRKEIQSNGTVLSDTITKNSKKNNVRPFFIHNTDGAERLVWMYGDYYDWIVSNNTPAGYPTAIHAGFELPKQTVNLTKGLLKHETFDHTNGFTGTATVSEGLLLVSDEKKATITTKIENDFTIVLSPFINPDEYHGEILKFGNITLGLNQDKTPKLFVKIDHIAYTSSNTLGNSDGWQQQARATNGRWYAPTQYNFFSLAVSYENNVLTTYINGLIDQSIEIDGLRFSEISLGGFSGLIDDCRIYNRPLLGDELQTLSKERDDITGISMR